MRNKKNKSLPVVFFITLLIGSFSSIVSAESLQKKLEMCKHEFSVSHQKDAAQGVAAVAKLKHLKLMKEILHELNQKNSDKKLSSADLQENVMVMSHLLEMLVTENLAAKNESWGMNY